MKRPCFLVIDREYSGSISTRKLVIETAKINVITAYSGEEAIGTLERFPHVDGVVLDAGIKDVPCTELVAQLRARNSKIPIVVIDSPLAPPCPGATHHLRSFEPATLLDLLKKMEPEPSQKIDSREEVLAEIQEYPNPPE